MKTRDHKRVAEHEGKTEGAPTSASARGPPFDIHQRITDQILAAMEQTPTRGRRFWNSHPSLPMNLPANKRYSGINILML